jgi:uncharacterized linocin/CFP29 family protein
MNNLHRDLAPVSDAAWEQIEQEASRTLKRHLAARRVVDVAGPKGLELAAVGTGHVRPIPAPDDGMLAAQREAKALVELYFQETFTFRLLTTEAAVVLARPEKK